MHSIRIAAVPFTDIVTLSAYAAEKGWSFLWIFLTLKVDEDRMNSNRKRRVAKLELPGSKGENCMWTISYQDFGKLQLQLWASQERTDGVQKTSHMPALELQVLLIWLYPKIILHPPPTRSIVCNFVCTTFPGVKCDICATPQVLQYTLWVAAGYQDSTVAT